MTENAVTTIAQALAANGINPEQLGAIGSEPITAVAANALNALVNSNDPEVRVKMLRMRVGMHQQQISALLAEADLIEHTARLTLVVESKRAELETAEQAADVARQAVSTRIDEERAALDKSRTAADYARQTRETAEDLTLNQAAPDQQTDALIRRDAAADVATRAVETAAWATQARVGAERYAEEAAEAVRLAKALLRAAESMSATAAETVRPSEITLALDFQSMLLHGKLKPSEMPAVRGYVNSLAVLCGADQDMKRKAAEKAKAEAQEAAYLAAAQSATAAPRMGRAGMGTVIAPVPPR